MKLYVLGRPTYLRVKQSAIPYLTHSCACLPPRSLASQVYDCIRPTGEKCLQPIHIALRQGCLSLQEQVRQAAVSFDGPYATTFMWWIFYNVVSLLSGVARMTGAFAQSTQTGILQLSPQALLQSRHDVLLQSPGQRGVIDITAIQPVQCQHARCTAAWYAQTTV